MMHQQLVCFLPCYIFTLLIFSASCQERTVRQKPKLAIIGAGIGGTSAAYFLSAIPNFDADIDVYSKDPVGGRMATATIAGHEYETGGSILHPRNRYMRNFAEKFGLKPKKGISGKFGLFDGTKFVYQQGNTGIVNLATLLWRYGFSVLKVTSIIDKMLHKFERIYNLQQDGHMFVNILELLWAMDPSFVDMLERSLENGLKQEGIADVFIYELAVAVMRVNYGQSVNAHQFVGSVSLAGAESNLWSVHGGNKLIPMALLDASGAQLKANEVLEISLIAEDKFALHLKDVEDPVTYDAVILATPLTHDTYQLKFQNFPRQFQFSGSFHRTVATLVHGSINYETFGFTDAHSVIDEIFTTNTSLFFNSLSRNYPVDVDDGVSGLPEVWKVFSKEPLSQDQLQSLFSKVHEVKVIDWKAYPKYDGVLGTSGNFTLHPGLYHINSVEWAASAMEMSVIGAKNVALLAAHHLGVHDGLQNSREHTEL